jgi:hypothetical protein
MPANATAADWTNAANAGEAQIAAEYGAQAARQNAPVVDRNGTYVYSATNRYGNNWFGHAGAWADHNVPGMMAAERWLHSAGLDAPVGQPGGGLGGALGRIGTGAALYGTPVVGQGAAAYDTVANVYNALKSAVGVQGYDLPTAYGTATKALGVPQMDPNASGAQQVAEAILTGAPGARSVMGALVRPTASVVAGDVGQQIGESIDPRFGRLGALAGSFSPAAVEAGGSRIPRALASPNAAATRASLEALGITPSFTTLASPLGRMAAKTAQGTWLVGDPLRQANERVDRELLNSQQRAANQIATQAGGNPIVPAQGRIGMAPGDIGQHLIDGSRAAIQNIRQALDKQQTDFANRIHAAGPASEVSVTPIRATMEAYMANPNNGVTSAMRDMVNQHLDAMENQTRGTGAQPNPGYAPGWNVQGTDTLPWTVMKNQRAEINDALSNVPPGQAGPNEHLLGALDDAITNSMTTTADRVSPGMGQEFRDMSANYARNQRQILPEFYRVGGRPVTYQGVADYKGGLNPGQAYNELASRTKQKGLTPFLTQASENPAFPRENWAQAAGGFVSGLGEGPNASHRPEHAGRDWNNLGPDVQGAITLGPNGQPLQAAADLGNIAQAGGQTVVPVQRHGLSAHAASAGSMLFAAETLASLIHHAIDPISLIGATALTGGALRGATQTMESEAFKRAMTSPPTALTRALYNTIPSSAITMDQLYGPQPGAPTPATGRTPLIVPVPAPTASADNPNAPPAVPVPPPLPAPAPAPAPAPVPAPYAPSAAFNAAYPPSQ